MQGAEFQQGRAAARRTARSTHGPGHPDLTGGVGRHRVRERARRVLPGRDQPELRQARDQGAEGDTAVGSLMAVSILILIPVIILFFFAQRTFIQGITMSGIKE